MASCWVSAFNRVSAVAVRTGRWIWAPLTLALLWGVPWDYVKFNWHEVVSDWFFWFNPGQEEGPAGQVLITYPAWASIWYSFGLQVISHRKRQAMGELSPSRGNMATEHFAPELTKQFFWHE